MNQLVCLSLLAKYLRAKARAYSKVGPTRLDSVNGYDEKCTTRVEVADSDKRSSLPYRRVHYRGEKAYSWCP